MKNFVHIILFLLPILLAAQTENEQSIRIMQDQRLTGSLELFAKLTSGSDRERELALLAVANIQDTSAVDRVAPLLSDANPKVRSMAAFTLGMLNTPRSATLLFRRMAVEREDKCLAEILNALGMCGDQDDLKKLITQSEHFPNDWSPWVVSSIVRFANRKVRDHSATKYAASKLNDRSAVLNATYALLRINDTTVIRSVRSQLIDQLKSSSAVLRMWTAAALTALNDDGTAAALSVAGENDQDWRVRVNALRAIRNNPAARPLLLKTIADKNEHVALTAVASYDQQVKNEPALKDSTLLIGLLSSSSCLPAVKDEIRILLGKKMGERAMPLLGSWKDDRPYIAAQRIRAYGATRSEKAVPVIKEAIQQSGSSLVLIAGLEAYQSIAQRSNEQIKKDFLKTAVLLFGRNDAGISYASAIAFQDTSFSPEIRRIYLSSLITAYNGMKGESDLEPMVELLKVFAEMKDPSALPAIESGLASTDNVIRTAAEAAYTAVTDDDAPERSTDEKKGYSPFYTVKDLPMLNRFKGADVATSKGTIRITFDKEAAPFTVLNFILLAQKKFYDGLPFHRVVSNFVIQGGDPLGNGSGGPNYSIRSEVHPNARYKSGAVGMASAGKDTEGSQWFVTHCPTPHLDFRYTVFGYTPDAKVVDQIMIGDIIQRVTLVSGGK